ncbi:MAG: exo-rhamnogalacturonan lyase family protein [Armatimonadota bacterium]
MQNCLNPIRLWIDETIGIARMAEPVLGGVPLARGVWHGGGEFCLRSSDTGEYRVEGTPIAYWPDGSTKWLQICGVVDLAGGQRNEFHLLPLTEKAPAGLQVTEDGDGLLVTGGALRVRVAADPARVLEVQDADGQALLQGPGLSARIRLTEPEGPVRPAVAWSFEPTEAQAVVRTGNRVVVRLPGQFIEDARVVAELVVFVEVLRESRQIGIEPVFIYLGNPDHDLIAELSLTVHSVFTGESARYGFGNERGPGYWDVLQPYEGGPSWPQARQVQLGSSFYRTDKRTGAAASWTKAVEGQRAQGWCHLGTDRGGITAGLRYFWQEYPRALSLDTDTGDITVGLIPPDAEALDLRRYSPLGWGKAVYEYSEAGKPFATDSKGATGIAKASEVMIHFHPAGDRRAAEVGSAFAHPARLITDPVHLCASGVVGQMAPAPVPGYAAPEEEMVRLTDFLVNERAVRGWYGLMHFGDIMLAYYSDVDRWAYDDGGYAWINMEHIPDWGLWVSALRHGRTDWLNASIEMSRHNRDVDIYHRGELHGCGTRHNVNHWGCGDKEWRVSMPLVRRLHYYLTGDPWTREVILNTVAVYQSYERTCRTAPRMSSALIGLMVKFELTGDATDLQALRNITEVYARSVREDGHFVRMLRVDIATGEGEPVLDDTTLDGGYYFLHSFGAQHAIIEVADLFDHQVLYQGIVRHADRCIADTDTPRPGHSSTIYHGAPFLACAWRVTGDERYRAAIETGLQREPLVTLEVRGGDGPL